MTTEVRIMRMFGTDLCCSGLVGPGESAPSFLFALSDEWGPEEKAMFPEQWAKSKSNPANGS